MSQQTDPPRSERFMAPAPILERRARNRAGQLRPLLSDWTRQDELAQKKLWHLLAAVRAIRPRANGEVDRVAEKIVIRDWDTDEVLGEASLSAQSRWHEIPAWQDALSKLEKGAA